MPQSTKPAGTAVASARDLAQNTDYRVSSVTKATPPAGMEGGDWYRYVLEGGHSPITGWRRGSLSDVTEFARISADELNERRSGKSVSYQRGRPARKA